MEIAGNTVMNDILNLQAEDGSVTNKNKKYKIKIKYDISEGHRTVSVRSTKYAIRNEQMELKRARLEFNLGTSTES